MVKTFIKKLKDTIKAAGLEEGFLSGQSAEDNLDIQPHEKDYLHHLRKVRDVDAGDICIPRVDIMAIDQDWSMQEVLDFIEEQRYTRYPVHTGKLDDVMGILHMKDLFLYLRANPKILGEPLKNHLSLLRPAPYVSPSMRILDVLAFMRREKTHIVLVVDEHGGVDGLITLKNLVENIVGAWEEAEEETDEVTPPEVLHDGSVIFDARTELSELSEQLGIHLDPGDEEAKTLAGRVLALAAHVPVRGEIIRDELPLEYEIIEASLRQIKRIRVRKISQDADPSC